MFALRPVRAWLPDADIVAGLRRLTLILLVLLMTGCDDPQQPDAVWMETGRAAGQVIYPRAIARDEANGWWYVVDRVGHVQRLSDDGADVLADWEMPEWGNGKPTGMSVGPGGNLWVADTHYYQVIVFTPDGQEVLRYGEYGDEPGQFRLPTDVAFDGDGRVYIAEYNNNDRVQVFSREGKSLTLLDQIGKFGEGIADFRRPQSLVIQPGAGGEPELLVADAVNHRIIVFTLDGEHLRTIAGPGVLNLPYGLDAFADGTLVATEFGANRVTLLDPRDGAVLGRWGSGGRRPGRLSYPWASAVAGDGRVVIVDSGNNRLQVIHRDDFRLSDG